MTRHRRPPLAGIAASLLLALALAGCAPDPSAPTDPSGAPSETPSSAAESPTTAPTPGATATPADASAVAVPTDCRALLSESVLAQLDGIPLNDPAWGATGVQADGSLKCIWAKPGADEGLTTVISKMSRGPALDMLNKLVAEQAFTCFQPDAGTRCERQWANATDPATNDGRTLYWRDGILVDTTYTRLAPSGYTASIVEHIFA